MNKSMADISTAVSAALQFGKEGVNFHRVLSSRYGYIVSREGVGPVNVEYRGTTVAVVNTDMSVSLYNGGYESSTTKNVINAALAGARIRAKVFQKNFTWYVGVNPSTDYSAAWADYHYENHMVIKADLSASGETYDFTIKYPSRPGRCRYYFGIVGVYHGMARDDLDGMCEACAAS